VLSILSPALQCAWGLESWQLGMITSVVFIGMACGSSVWGALSDRFGRKKVGSETLALGSMTRMISVSHDRANRRPLSESLRVFQSHQSCPLSTLTRRLVPNNPL